MNKTIESTQSADQASVSRLAYQLWENAGRPVGRDLEFWLAAEARLRSVSEQPAAVVTSPIQTKTAKAPRVGSNGKKTWPKPYPNLPKF